MGIRAKLLVLLVITAIVPVLVAAVVGRQTMRGLGEELSEQTQRRLIQDEREQLSVIAGSLTETVRTRASEIKRLLQVQTAAARQALEGPVPEDAVWYDSREDFDRGTRAVPGLVDRATTSVDSQQRVQRVSMEHQSMLLRSGGDLAEQVATANRLSQLDAMYRAASADRPVLLYGQYVSTVDGVHAKFPGHGGYPDGFDPRSRSWYRVAERVFRDDPARQQPVWGPPLIDVTTQQLIITASMPIVGSDGRLLGVSAVDVRISDVLSGVPDALPWASEARALIAVIVEQDREAFQHIIGWSGGSMPDEGSVMILAERNQTAQGLNWTAQPETATLRFDDPAHIEGLGEAVRAGRRAIIDCSIDGKPYLCSYTPFRFEGDDDLTAMILLVPSEAFNAIPNQIRASFEQQIATQLTTNLGLLVFAVALVVFAALILSKRLTRPVNALSAAAKRVAGGDLDTTVDVEGNDELGQLAHSFNEMLPQLRDRMSLRQSLQLAKDVQQQLLPQATPRVTGLDIAGLSEYCDETGGDYYDYIALGDANDGIAVVIGDVTGHGIASALLMTTARAMLRSRIDDDMPLDELVNALNDDLVADTGDGRFMTMNLTVFKGREGGGAEFEWVSAGHDAPMIVGPEGIEEDDSIGDIPLGVQPSWRFSAHRASLEPGHMLVVGTDGIWEARNEAGEMYGKQRLRELLLSMRGESAQAVCDAVIAAVAAFRGSEAQTDDITLVVVRAE